LDTIDVILLFWIPKTASLSMDLSLFLPSLFLPGEWPLNRKWNWKSFCLKRRLIFRRHGWRILRII